MSIEFPGASNQDSSRTEELNTSCDPHIESAISETKESDTEIVQAHTPVTISEDKPIDMLELNYLEEAYLKGLVIAEKRTTGLLNGITENHNVEFFRSILNKEAQLTSEQKAEIEKKAEPIYHTLNLLFHTSPELRIPVIAKIGIIPNDTVDRYTRLKYGGKTAISSGWGSSGYNHSSVWDPTKAAGLAKIVSERSIPAVRIWESEQMFKQIYPDGKAYSKEYEKIRDYEVVPNFDATEYIYYGGRTGNAMQENSNVMRSPFTFVIKLDVNKNDKLIRWRNYESWFHTYEGWSIVKGRIRPEEIVGLIMHQDYGLLEYDKILDLEEKYDRDHPDIKGGASERPNNVPFHEHTEEWPGKRSKEELISILGNNIKLPIYNTRGDLLWPKNISEQDLLNRSLEQPGDASNEFPGESIQGHLKQKE